MGAEGVIEEFVHSIFCFTDGKQKGVIVDFSETLIDELSTEVGFLFFFLQSEKVIIWFPKL